MSVVELGLSRREVVGGLLLASGVAVAPGLLLPNGTVAASESKGHPQKKAGGRPLDNGFTVTSRRQGKLGERGGPALKRLAEIGVRSVAFVPTALQDNIHATEIRRDTPVTSTYEEIRNAMRIAKDLGLAVMLKPHIDIQGFNEWRGRIGEGFTPEMWAKWFGSYREFILPYAEISQEEGAEIFVAGTELVTASPNTDHWRTIIQDIKRVRRGAISYAANHSGEENALGFADELDLVGVDFYYPLTDTRNPSVAEIQQGASRRLNDLMVLSDRYNRMILLSEVGFRNVVGATITPWKYLEAGTQSEQEQANAYVALMPLFADPQWREFLVGSFWWEWMVTAENRRLVNHDPQGKDAEKVIVDFYAGQNA